MIYIVRHGETDWNIKGLYQGSKDTELTEVGIAQAEELKEKLKEISFDVVISSPLKRAYDTARIITGSTNIEKDARIIERIGGDLEGRTLKEAFSLVDFNNPNENRYNIENINDFKKRINDFINDINEKYKNKNILIVTHAGVCVCIRCIFEGEPKENAFEKYKIGNCEIIKYDNL